MVAFVIKYCVLFVDAVCFNPTELSPEFLNPFSKNEQQHSNGFNPTVVNPNNTCFRCGEQGHYANSCQNTPNPNAYNPVRAAFWQGQRGGRGFGNRGGFVPRGGGFGSRPGFTSELGSRDSSDPADFVVAGGDFDPAKSSGDYQAMSDVPETGLMEPTSSRRDRRRDEYDHRDETYDGHDRRHDRREDRSHYDDHRKSHRSDVDGLRRSFLKQAQMEFESDVQRSRSRGRRDHSRDDRDR